MAKKKLNSLNSIIYSFMDELSFTGSCTIINEPEFIKQTKFFLMESNNYNIEFLLTLKEDVDNAIEELEAFEKKLH